MARRPSAGVTGEALAVLAGVPFGRAEQGDPGAAFGDLGGSVFGMVIDDDHLVVRRRLPAETVEENRQVVLFIARRDDDGYGSPRRAAGGRSRGDGPHTPQG
jgi:hypothetical protein